MAVEAYLANGPCRESRCNSDLDEQGNGQIQVSTKDDWKHSKQFTMLELCQVVRGQLMNILVTLILSAMPTNMVYDDIGGLKL